MRHRVVPDEHLHQCICGDWHPGSFYVTSPADDALRAALEAAERVSQAIALGIDASELDRLNRDFYDRFRAIRN